MLANCSSNLSFHIQLIILELPKGPCQNATRREGSLLASCRAASHEFTKELILTLALLRAGRLPPLSVGRARWRKGNIFSLGSPIAGRRIERKSALYFASLEFCGVPCSTKKYNSLHECPFVARWPSGGSTGPEKGKLRVQIPVIDASPFAADSPWCF